MKRFLFVFPFVFILFWTGCIPQDAPGNTELKYFKEEIGSFDFSLKEGLLELLAEIGVEETDPTISKVIAFLDNILSTQMRVVAISYNTYDPFGNPVLGTGAFVYPLDLQVRGIIEVPPIADLDQETSPSIVTQKGRFYVEAFPSLLKFITITPDMLGVNYTRHMPRPYLHDANSGLVAYHMRKAVEEYLLEKENYQLGNKSMVMGYSLGGPSSLSIAKYYTTNPTGVLVDKVFTGGGAYDGLEAFKAYARTEKNDYMAIPWIIITMDYYYQLGLDHSKIFANGMENPVNSPDPAQGGDGYAYWFDGTHGSGSLHRRWGSDLRNYMHEDFFSDELKGEFVKLEACMKENSLVRSWTPDPLLDIHLLHSSEDNLVPVECADYLYETFKEKGCSVHYVRTTGDHYDAGNEFVMTSLLYLLLK
ncbi:MAG: hypothetical protein GX877_00560 [Bacteroidales bacterium]|nr:hypothetical protein [Bacteroidales bacterium]